MVRNAGEDQEVFKNHGQPNTTEQYKVTNLSLWKISRTEVCGEALPPKHAGTAINDND